MEGSLAWTLQKRQDKEKLSNSSQLKEVKETRQLNGTWDPRFGSWTRESSFFFFLSIKDMIGTTGKNVIRSARKIMY